VNNLFLIFPSFPVYVSQLQSPLHLYYEIIERDDCHFANPAKAKAKALQKGSDKGFTENIPQLDGGPEEAKIDDPNYCIICKDSDEIESAEDFSYHMMIDHDPHKVLAIIGQTWIEERRHCIRRRYPFENWGFTPII
jgi:hypothetical protein